MVKRRNAKRIRGVWGEGKSEKEWGIKYDKDRIKVE